MTKFQKAYPISTKHLELIGALAAQWTFLEYALLLAICEVTNPKEVPDGLFLGWNLGFWSRIDLLKVYANAIKQEHESEGARLNAILQRIGEVYALRNKYVHGLWITNGKPNEPHLINLRLKGKLALSNDQITTTQMTNDANEIWEAADAFLTFMQGHGFLKGLLPSHGTPE